MRPFAVIDSETDPFLFGRVPKPFIWGFYDGDVYEEFDSELALMEYLNNRGKLIVYAHNGGKFDYHFLLDFLEPNREIMFINGRIAKFKIGETEFRDSFNILPIPLKAYQKDDFDYRILEEGEREKPHNKKLISSYLQGDCRYLWELVNAFRAKHGDALTQAGASMRLFKEITGREPPRSTEDYFQSLVPYYYGGRVQCFEKGNRVEPFEVYDINSAYPFAMLSPHPFGTEYSVIRGKVEYALEKPQAFFHLTCISKGAFPWRDRVGSKLTFPTDNVEREYFVTGWEVAAALEHGAISNVKVKRIIDFEECADFKDYILPIYAARKAAKAIGDKAEDILCKLAMNSLYGKFGADPNNYTRARLFEENAISDLIMGALDTPAGTYTYLSHLGDLPVGTRPLMDCEKRFYNVATAASITGYVRAFLFDSLQSVDGPLYCDTDSIACRSGEGLSTGDELGQWKLEGRFNEWAIAGRKLYAFFGDDGPKIACKGVKLEADEIREVAQGIEKTYRRDAPSFSVKYGARFVERRVNAQKD